ncbi:kinase-like domain-containing protein [Aspergillus keveii]|uniref:non-specific serine/threonine protein kinase n=1 Tax=Aspergillus keveii TaxID=714993 RepID=A0ABR4GEL3_9EURO
MASRMEPSKVKYQSVEDVERLDFYVPGGYHPDKHNNGRLVALKISTAESADRTPELEILSQLTKAETSLPGKAVVQSLLDSFRFSGPNGTHRCLVTDVERINLNEVKDYPYHRLLQLPVARAIAAQLVLGVQFIHSQGIVHGDLHPGNILLQLPPDMRNMALTQLHAKTHEPAKELVVREDGKPLDPGVPPEVVIPLWLGIDSDKVTLAEAPIRIADLGEAFNPSETKQYTAHAPLLLAPPESRFAEEGNLNDALTFPSDIWTLACTVWEIFGYGPPFEAFFVSLDKVTLEQELRQWHGNTHRDCDTRFSWCIREPREKHNLEFFTTEEDAAFRAMMKLMLVLEPSRRATIDE